MRDPLATATVAILGYGNQGEAHALNLRAGGTRVVVGARAGGEGESRAVAAGFETRELRDAAAAADVVAVLLPDEVVPALWADLVPRFRSAATLVFAHGFSLLYGDLAPRHPGDIVLVSPTGPGRVLRRLRESGGRLPAYVAVHQDASGAARETAGAYADRIGCGPLWHTTVREETEVDLFGEQVVLCGGMNALVTAAFEVLVERGYSPEIAYLECVHQLKYLADLLHERGPSGLRFGISGTAAYGDLTRGGRVIGPASREAMREILAEIRSGAYAREWIAEAAAGAPRLRSERDRASRHPIEAARSRALGAPGPGEPGG